MPQLHTSDFSEYYYLFRIYGLIYIGEPTIGLFNKLK